jgi:hypothetical protein
LITYDRFRSPAEVYQYFRRLGLTHLIFDPHGFRAPTKQQEVLWNALIRGAKSLGQFANYKVLELPKEGPKPEPPWRVAVFGFQRYVDGIYPIERLNTDEQLPAKLQHFAIPTERFAADRAERKKQLENVQAILVGRAGRVDDLSDLLQKQFERNLAVDPFTLYLRK